MQGGIRFSLFDDLYQLSMLCDQLPKVGHLLEQLGEKEVIVRMVVLQVKLEHVHDALLHPLNVSHVQETRPI